MTTTTLAAIPEPLWAVEDVAWQVPQVAADTRGRRPIPRVRHR